MMLHFSLKIWILSANDLLTIQLLLNILKQFRGYFVVTETKFKNFYIPNFCFAILIHSLAMIILWI